MDIERLKELQNVVEAKSCRTEIDDNDGEEFEYEIEDKELMWALEECSDLIDAAIARQSVTSEQVAEAIEWVTNTRHRNQYMSGDWTAPMGNHINRTIQDTIITALQAYQPKGE